MRVVFDTNIFISAFVIPGSMAADAIVTGDRDVLNLGMFGKIKMLSLKNYLE